MATISSIRIEGGLLGPDILDQVLTGDLPGQKPADFGLEARRNLTDEIASVFADARAMWGVFQNRLSKLKDDDPATTVTRDAWVIPFLGLLGYAPSYNAKAWDVDGLTFAISHRASEDTESPPVHIVGARQELGRVPASGRTRLAPHSLLQEYLNRTEQLWGLVTNGLTLRLLRDCSFVRRQAYIEFDLPAILDEQRFQDFAALYRLIHRSRLPRRPADTECFIERYYVHSMEQGGRVREHLRDGVEECIRMLANGFLRHPGNAELQQRVAPAYTDADRMSADGLYRQLLTLVYRFLFLLVSEDRGLLSKSPLYHQHYGIARLRRLLDQRATFSDDDDLWQSLRVLWTVLVRDEVQPSLNNQPMAAVLGLPVLNGELFAHQFLDSCTITNRDLLTAFWHLAWYTDTKTKVSRRVNYGALDVEELGSVYESLLELHPFLDGEQSRHWNFDFVKGGGRKETGSYYTPPELVNEVIESTLDPVIDSRLASNPQQREQALLSLRVCDPACGSGHFLLAAARRIAKALARVRTGEDEPAPERVRESVRDVIAHCIYGVDKNPLAVDLCRVALWLESHTADKPLTFLDHHIRCGDSLVGVFDLSVLNDALPDRAFEREGVEKAAAKAIAKRNKDERRGVRDLFAVRDSHDTASLTRHSLAVDAIPDDTPELIRRKKQLFEASHRDPDWLHQKQACDLWTAAFFQDLTDGALVISSAALVDHLAGKPIDARLHGRALTLAHRQPFFHWPLEFPDVFADRHFDVVLGNPPYGAELSDRERGFLSFRYGDMASARNSAAYFAGLGSQLVSERGRVGFVLPKSFTYSYAWVDCRTSLLPTILSVIDVGQAWPNVLLEQILLTYSSFHSTGQRAVKVGRIQNSAVTRLTTLDESIVSQLGIIPTGLSEQDYALLSALATNRSNTLGSICSTRRGTGLQRLLRSSGDLPVLAGRDIAQFAKPQPSLFINSDEVPESKVRKAAPPQVVFQNIVAHITRPSDHIRLIGTVVETEMACLDTVNLLELHDNSVSPQVICGLLMSDIVNWFVYTCVYNRAIRTMHFDGYFLSKIIVPSVCDLPALSEVTELVESNPKSESAWSQLNNAVYDLYKIPEDLRRYVSQMHKPRWL